MRKFCELAFLVFLVIMSCTPESDSTFSPLENNQVVNIILSDYELETIPPDIGNLTDCTELTISKDEIQENWMILPPKSSLLDLASKPPLNKMPEEVNHLSKLKVLKAIHCDLAQLPDDLNGLKSLEILDLSFNKLNIKNELPKFEHLPKLKQLTITYNLIDTTSIKTWQNNHPEIEVIY